MINLWLECCNDRKLFHELGVLNTKFVTGERGERRGTSAQDGVTFWLR